MKNKLEENYFPDITSYLKDGKISQTQKHKDFHIVNFKKLERNEPMKVSSRKLGFFQIVVSALHEDAELKIDDFHYKGKQQGIIFVAPEQMVSFDSKGKKPNDDGYLLVFSPDFLNVAPSIFSMLKNFPYFNVNRPPVYFLQSSQNKYFVDTMKKMLFHFQNLNNDNLEIIRSYLTIMLIEAKRMFLDGEVKSIANSRV